MSSDVRSFSFSGTLVARSSSDYPATLSDSSVFLAEGVLKYIGVCENGKPCEMPMDMEPESTAMRFSNAFATKKKKFKVAAAENGDDDSNDLDSSLSSGSQADEVSEEKAKEQKKRSAAAAPKKRDNTTLENRKTCCIMIRNNGRLLLPHLGMSMFVYLKRSEPLTSTDASVNIVINRSGRLSDRYRYFYYDITQVCSVRICTEEPRASIIQRTMLPLLPQIVEDASKAAARAMLLKTKLSKESVFNNRTLMNQQRSMLLTTAVVISDGLRNTLAQIDRLDSRAFASLPTLLRSIERVSAGASTTIVARFLTAFVNQYAVAYNQSLCVDVCGGTKQPQTITNGRVDRLLAFCGIQGRYGIARLAASTSRRELTTLASALSACRSNAPQHAVFTAGCIELPLWYMQNKRRIMMQFDGMYIKPTSKGNRYNSGMTLYVQQLVPEFTEDTELSIVGYARALLDAIQRNFRTFAADTMVDVYQLLSFSAQRNAKLSRISKRDSPMLRKVLELLLHNGALHPVPTSAIERMTTQNRLFSLMSVAERRDRISPMLVCTRQQWRISSQLVYYARQLALTLAPHTCGGYIDLQLDSDRRWPMYIYCGARPKLSTQAAAQHSFIISLAALLESTQLFENESLHAIELLSVTDFVLCDANLLDESALLQFLQFMHAHRKFASMKQILLLGDPALYSPFSALLSSKRFARVFYKPFWPARDTLAQLRYACSTAVQDGISMRAFCNSVVEQTPLTMAGAAARLLRNERRRWILMTESNRQAALAAGKLSALFSQVASSVAVPVSSANASSTPPRPSKMEELASLFARVAAGEYDSLRTHLACSAPFVAFTMHRVTVRVNALHFMQKLAPRNEYTTAQHCRSCSVRPLARDNEKSFDDCGELVSLDNPLLLIEIDSTDCAAMGIDHRRCCWTWQSNIVHVARHRSELQAQSFCTAREALPCNDNASPIVIMGDEFRYPDLYGALVRAIPNVTEKLLVVDCKPALLTQKTLATFPKPRTFLGDLLAIK